MKIKPKELLLTILDIFLIFLRLGATSFGGPIGGVCAVSTPIDLAACSRRLGEARNRLYERRFLKRMKQRIRHRSRLMPEVFSTRGLNGVASMWEFDDRITAPAFGFRGAGDYYGTQSAMRFLDAIRVPTLVVSAKDDPLIPFEAFGHPAFETNPALRLEPVEHGGHLGFLGRRRPRFWLDGKILNWAINLRNKANSYAVDN